MPFPTADKWTDGIYFGLDEEFYHSLPWCGSNDTKDLYASPPDFWFNSHMNPLRPADEPSFAQTQGKALHHRILYGEEAFKRDYVCFDDPKPTSQGSVSAEGLKAFIESQGGTVQKLKSENERYIAEELKLRLLPRDLYNKVAVSAAQIVKNPHLAQAFVGGFPEVSIFWHSPEGVPCKCRLDYFKQKATVDLKSFSSKQRIRTLDETILQDLFNYRYDMQIGHYHHGRQAAWSLFNTGKVYAEEGAAMPSSDWLNKALSNQAPGWVFVFFKSDGMPISKSYQVPFGSPAHEHGRQDCVIAYRNYQDNLAKFGTDAWVNTDEPYEIAEEDIPKWL